MAKKEKASVSKVVKPKKKGKAKKRPNKKESKKVYVGQGK
jgi:hypothetical protein